MLTKLLIKNFQKHKKKIIQLEQITTLIGRTDSGKSSIFRALIWLLTNKPRGTSFITHGKEEATVGIQVDGQKIIRCRSKKLNEYFLNAERYVAFGENVPVPISELLNIGPNNIQKQHDPVFWLGLSPSELSRQMNAVVDLDIIDRATKISKRIKTEAASRKKFEQERYDHWSEQVETLSFVPKLEQLAKAARKAQKESSLCNAVLANLGVDIAATQHNAKVAETTRETAAVAASCKENLEGHQETEKKVKWLSIRIEKIQNFKQHDMEDEMNNLQKRSDAIDTLLDEIDGLNELIEVLRKRNASLCQLNESLLKEKAIIEKASKKLLCPKCGQIIMERLS